MLQPRAPLAHARVLAAFEAAADAFLRTVGGVREWESTALGEWNVRELVAHTLRAYTTIETYLAASPSVDAELEDATSYYRVVLAPAGIHAGVAERGREAGRALIDPVPQSHEMVERVLTVVRATPADQSVEMFAGRMVFTEYLATRTIEVGLHTLDLQSATGQEPGLPEDVTRLCLDVLLPLADDVDLLRAVTGRGTLNVLG